MLLRASHSCKNQILQQQRSLSKSGSIVVNDMISTTKRKNHTTTMSNTTTSAHPTSRTLNNRYTRMIPSNGAKCYHTNRYMLNEQEEIREVPNIRNLAIIAHVDVGKTVCCVNKIFWFDFAASLIVRCRRQRLQMER